MDPNSNGTTMTKQQFIEYVVKTLQETLRPFPQPLVDVMIAEFGPDPFFILVSCLLSLRARDRVTIHVCRNLFTKIRSFQELLALSSPELEQLIYKTGYYKTKAKVLHGVAQAILSQHQGKVPATAEELLSLHGVGLKTANLVLGLAYNIPAICVDTHVQRISNIFGIVTTKTAEDTEAQLKKILPENYWIEWNRLLVILGQNICTPPVPRCSVCPLQKECPKIGVTKSR